MGVLYLFWVWVASGSPDSREFKHVLADVISFPAGIFLIVVGALNAYDGVISEDTGILLAVGAFLLIVKVLYDLPWTTIVALMMGTGVGLGVWYFIGSYLPWYGPLVAGFIVFFIVSLLLVPAEGLFKLIGLLLVPRPFLFILAVLFLVEGGLVLYGGSIFAL